MMSSQNHTSIAFFIAVLIFVSSNAQAGRLDGKWISNPERTIQSMKEIGKISDERVALFSNILGDLKFNFTDSRMSASFLSDPSIAYDEIEFEVLVEDETSILISYEIALFDKDTQMFHFSEDGDCIYLSHEAYRDYFCQ
ncbi:hypothetical protein [uncultured Endozoicomonas sp.]|uniref:hypothetical protein n=1 Tax=uncultured Endozoicomonas sp. TaxID=432652 RepID=UPI00260A7951|nr:hypothetical protein [uncultured Endozoicomonas sp.]